MQRKILIFLLLFVALIVVVFSAYKKESLKARIFGKECIYLHSMLDKNSIVWPNLDEILNLPAKKLQYSIFSNKPFSPSIVTAYVLKTIEEKKDLEEVTLQYFLDYKGKEKQSESTYIGFSSVTDYVLKEMVGVLRANENIKKLFLLEFDITGNAIAELLYKNNTLESLFVRSRNVDLGKIAEGLRNNDGLKDLTIISYLSGEKLNNLKLNGVNSLESLKIYISKEFALGLENLAINIVNNKSIKELEIHSGSYTGFAKKFFINFFNKVGRYVDVKDGYDDDHDYDGYGDSIINLKANHREKKIRSIVYDYESQNFIDKCIAQTLLYQYSDKPISYYDTFFICKITYNDDYIIKLNYKIKDFVKEKFTSTQVPFSYEKARKDLMGLYPQYIKNLIDDVK